jgi:hypothetical protein
MPGLISEREIRNWLSDGKRRRQRVLLSRRASSCGRRTNSGSLLQAFVVAHANILGIRLVFFNNKREVHKHARFQAFERLRLAYMERHYHSFHVPGYRRTGCNEGPVELVYTEDQRGHRVSRFRSADSIEKQAARAGNNAGNNARVIEFSSRLPAGTDAVPVSCIAQRTL